MILSQEIIPVDTLAEAGIVTILGIAILTLAIVGIYFIRYVMGLQKSVSLRDDSQDTTLREVVTLASSVVKTNEELQKTLQDMPQRYEAALNRNTSAFQALTEALGEFKAGIDSKLNEQTEAIQSLASKIEANGTLTFKQLFGTSLTIELPDGSEVIVELVETDSGFKIKVHKKEIADVVTDSGNGE